MDVKERLSLEDVSAHSLMAIEHLHRYEWVAPAVAGLRVLDLCCGVGYGSRILATTATTVLGIDRDAAAIDTAATSARTDDNTKFVAADALRHLQRTEPEDVDLIVCFEGLEHVDNLDGVIDELQRLTAAGCALVASIPNSLAFEEENPHHHTDFGFESAHDLASRFPGSTVAYQTHAEGSLIRTEISEAVDPTLLLPDGMDTDYANHFIIAVGVDIPALFAEASAKMQLAISPFMHRYKRGLEHAVADLRAINARLARERLGMGHAAAGARTARLEEYLDWERSENDRLRDHLARTAAERDRLRHELHLIETSNVPNEAPVDQAQELAVLRRERDDLRRVAIIARGSRLVRLAARMAGHDVDAPSEGAPPVGTQRWSIRLRGHTRRR